MHRTFALASLVPALPALAACARAPDAGPRPPRAPDPPPLAVSYRVLRSGDGDGVVLSGRTQIDAGHAARVVAVAPRSSAEEELEIATRPRDDGAVLVEVNYEETGADGARIKWHPVVRLARGATARADVSAPGWSRAIEVTLE